MFLCVTVYFLLVKNYCKEDYLTPCCISLSWFEWILKKYTKKQLCYQYIIVTLATLNKGTQAVV